MALLGKATVGRNLFCCRRGRANLLLLVLTHGLGHLTKLRPWALALIGALVFAGAGYTTGAALKTFGIVYLTPPGSTLYLYLSSILSLVGIGAGLYALEPGALDFRLTRPSFPWLMAGLAIGIASYFLYAFVERPISVLLHLTVPTSSPYFTSGLQSGDVVALFVAVGIFSPIVQELFFRGWILSALERVNAATAVIVSAVGFGLLHAPIGGATVFHTVVDGLLMGYVTLKSKSVVPAMIIHITINAGSAGAYIWLHYR
jgi:membrane protease YdiL (CAAX protease family)